jgi:hypothetical protein
LKALASFHDNSSNSIKWIKKYAQAKARTLSLHFALIYIYETSSPVSFNLSSNFKKWIFFIKINALSISI